MEAYNFVNENDTHEQSSLAPCENTFEKKYFETLENDLWNKIRKKFGRVWNVNRYEFRWVSPLAQ